MNDAHAHDITAGSFKVDLPGGGSVSLQTQDEAELWDDSHKRYLESYGLSEQNDLVLLGAILSQQLAMYRAQQRMTGMVPEFDDQGLSTGRYISANLKAADLTAAQNTVTKAATEIRELEKSLGIDKKTREQGGQATVATYINTLKEAARRYGLHISKRLKEYERVAMEARWKLRVLRNGDAEDRAYHDLSPQKIIDWLEVELAKLEEADKTYAREIGHLYVGRLR
jgi:hypothetical protein